ncbi:podocalyxin isoform X1 [Brienomyrus brachyistius]|uniref:podocalyxin isoform X1 n=1 Tax=Brienomyrus brachyistius TaxID=42636 RepID=UPI0020B24E89|nr:podocalyxin isoform X1 [Brienomyrus brachyistius]
MRSLWALLLMGISSVSATMESNEISRQMSSPTPNHTDSTTSGPGSIIPTSNTSVAIIQLTNFTESTSTSNLPTAVRSTAAQTTAPITSTLEASTEHKASDKPTTTIKPNASRPTTEAPKSKVSISTISATEFKISLPTLLASTTLVPPTVSMTQATNKPTIASESNSSPPPTTATESKSSPPPTTATESKSSPPPTTATESKSSPPPTTATESKSSPPPTTATESKSSPQPTTAIQSAMTTRPMTTKLPVTSISETLRPAITTQNMMLDSTVPESIPTSISSSPASVIAPSTNKTPLFTKNSKSSKEVCEYLMAWIVEDCDIQRIGRGQYSLKIYSTKIIDEPPSKPTQSYNAKLIAALVTTFILLSIIALSSFFLWRRRSYKMNQQQLTEELHTCENGYHDNPTLEVMEVQPEMQEKKVALTKELHDTWIVPLDNLAKVDLLDEEDTHL